MIIDMHNHIGPANPVIEQSVSDLLKRMDRAGVDKAVVFPFPQVIDSDCNNYIAEAVKRHKDRLIGFCCVNPWYKSAAEELIRCLDGLGLSGLKLHPLVHWYSLSHHEILDPIFKICSDYKVPITAHGMCDVTNMPSDFEEMANTFPDVTLFMSHMGVVWANSQAIKVAKRTPNLWLDTTICLGCDVSDAVNEIPDKVVMGTDTPASEFEPEILKIRLACPSKEIEAKVLGDNLVRFFRLN